MWMIVRFDLDGGFEKAAGHRANCADAWKQVAAFVGRGSLIE
jgi:hypothetical protein